LVETRFRGGRPPALGREARKERNTAERCVNEVKGHRVVALRTDEHERIHQGRSLDQIWLRGPIT
jgi:hypothetical protein